MFARFLSLVVYRFALFILPFKLHLGYASLLVLSRMLQDKDATKSERVMSAVLQMKKLDIKALKQAYAGRPRA